MSEVSNGVFGYHRIDARYERFDLRLHGCGQRDRKAEEEEVDVSKAIRYEFLNVRLAT